MAPPPLPVRGTTSALRWLSIVLVLFALGLVTIAFLVFEPGERASTLAVAALIVAAAAVPFLFRGRIERPIFTVTADGFELPRRGLVRWRDVEEVRIVDGRHGTYFGLELAEDAPVRRSLGRFGRAAGLLNRPLGYPTLSWPDTILPLEVDELVREVEARAGTQMPPLRRADGSILEHIQP